MTPQIIGLDGLFINLNGVLSIEAAEVTIEGKLQDGAILTTLTGDELEYGKDDADKIFEKVEFFENETLAVLARMQNVAAQMEAAANQQQS